MSPNSADDQRARARRLAAAAPDDPKAHLDWLLTRLRLEGKQVLFEVSADHNIWRRSLPHTRELLAEELLQRFGSDYSYLGIEEYQCAGVQNPVARFRHEITGIVLHLIPGNPKAENNEPTNAFLIGQFPVRQQEWDKFRQTDSRSWQGADLPIEGVSFDSVQKWLSTVDAGFRLGSQAEWTFACNADTAFDYYWGNTMDETYVWYDDNSDNRPHNVYEHIDKTNAFGLIDMLGNLWEFTSDPEAADLRDQYRRVRGGCWGNYTNFVKTLYTHSYERTRAIEYAGFRVFRELP